MNHQVLPDPLVPRFRAMYPQEVFSHQHFDLAAILHIDWDTVAAADRNIMSIMHADPNAYLAANVVLAQYIALAPSNTNAPGPQSWDDILLVHRRHDILVRLWRQRFVVEWDCALNCMIWNNQIVRFGRYSKTKTLMRRFFGNNMFYIPNISVALVLTKRLLAETSHLLHLQKHSPGP